MTTTRSALRKATCSRICKIWVTAGHRVETPALAKWGLFRRPTQRLLAGGDAGEDAVEEQGGRQKPLTPFSVVKDSTSSPRHVIERHTPSALTTESLFPRVTSPCFAEEEPEEESQEESWKDLTKI